VEYLRGQVGRVSMIDISNVAMPRIIDRVTVGQGAWGVVAKEHTAFVQCGARVKVFNLANPDKPRRIRDIIPRQQASRLAIDGEHLFVGDVDGFQIWNIADPNMPKFLGQFSFS